VWRRVFDGGKIRRGGFWCKPVEFALPTKVAGHRIDNFPLVMCGRVGLALRAGRSQPAGQ